MVESFRAHALASRPCDGDESAHGSQNSITADMLVKLESTENLSRGARRALRDFCNHLKVLKKKALDEEGKLHMIIVDIICSILTVHIFN